jgi:putative intracellular protease/amidase
MSKTAYLYVFDTLSDWETGYLAAELNTSRFFRKGVDKYTVKTVGIKKEPIVTMGGVRIIPDITVQEISKENTGVLILPGGETWLESIHTPILEIAKDFLASGIVVAAICGATIGLAKADILNDKKHTSNDLGYLKLVCPNYTGEELYQELPAVSEGKLITASGSAPLQLAYETIKLLDVFSIDTLDAWYNLNLTHESKYFYALMESLEQ